MAQLLEEFRRRESTSEQLVTSLIARIDEREPAVHAWAHLDRAQALERARNADRHIRAGKTGELLGIPVGIKDVIDVHGMPTGRGSPLFAGRQPECSATIVERLERAGGFVLGKTVTAEFAYLHPGPTRNPWNPAHTPGGSSMGSAAAVADGMVPAAIGTQTNGSVIRPAAFCGCVGYKPSQGLLPRTGVQPLSPTLDQLGIFTRSVPDAAIVAGALIGHDPKDPLSLSDMSLSQNDFVLRSRYQPPRLAVVRSPVWHLAEPAQRQRFEENLAALRAAGALVEDLDLGSAFEIAHETLRIIMFAEGAVTFAKLHAQQRDQLSPELNQLIEEGSRLRATRFEGGARAAPTAAHRAVTAHAVVRRRRHAAGARRGAGHVRSHRRPLLLHDLDPVRCAGRHHSGRSGPAGSATRTAIGRPLSRRPIAVVGGAMVRAGDRPAGTHAGLTGPGTAGISGKLIHPSPSGRRRG